LDDATSRKGFGRIVGVWKMVSSTVLVALTAIYEQRALTLAFSIFFKRGSLFALQAAERKMMAQAPLAPMCEQQKGEQPK
jgi:cbb3-type cytochrome oxidase subunit 3